MSTAQWRHPRQEGLATSKFGWLEHNFLSCWLSLSMDLFCTGKKYQPRMWKIKRRVGQNKNWIKRSSVLILQHWSSVLSALLCLQYPTGLEIHYNISTISRHEMPLLNPCFWILLFLVTHLPYSEVTNNCM